MKAIRLIIVLLVLTMICAYSSENKSKYDIVQEKAKVI